MTRALAVFVTLTIAVCTARAAAAASCVSIGEIDSLPDPSYEAVVEDFDGDGVPDLATGGGNRVTIQRGRSSPTGVSFGDPYEITVGLTPRGITSGDFNRDGAPDLAIAVDAADEVQIYLSAGTRSNWSMQRSATYLTGTRPISVAAGDLSGDDILDLVVSNANEASISVFIGRGDGTFGTRSDYSAGGSAYKLRLGDVNRDGLLDAVVASPARSGVSVLQNNGGSGVGASMFRAASVFSFGVGRLYSAVALADLDADGILDVVLTGSRIQSLTTLLGRINGSGSYRLIAPGDYDMSGVVIPPDTPRDVVVLDANRDSLPDIATVFPLGVANVRARTLGIYLGAADVLYQPAEPYDGPASAVGLTAADIDNDGAQDLVAVGLGGTYAIYRGSCPGAPTVTSFTPDAGAVGDTVIVRGTGLSAVANVRFNGAIAEIIARSVLSITVRVPPGASTGPIRVEGPYGSGLSSASFVVGEKPRLSRVVPDRAKAGRTVEVFGAFLGETREVRIGSGPPASFEVLADSIVRVAIDTLARSGPISLRTRFGSTTSDFVFTVLPSDTSALIESVRDVPDDEGGRVLVEWLASDLDVPGRGLILGYRVMRRDFVAFPSVVQALAATEIWQEVASVPATFLPRYSAIAATLSDSIADGIPFYTFRVDAFTADTSVTFVSDTASGYSVDNLAPPAPADVTSRVDMEEVELTWAANPATDFLAYHVYRGDQPGFPLDDGHLIATITEPRLRDRPGYGVHWYRIVAIDVHGNRGVSPEIGVGGPPLPERLELSRLGPNPASGPLSLVLALPVAGTVELEVIDISGRRVLERLAVFADPGIQRLTWNDVGLLKPGVYFLRMRQQAWTVHRRFVVSR